MTVQEPDSEWAYGFLLPDNPSLFRRALLTEWSQARPVVRNPDTFTMSRKPTPGNGRYVDTVMASRNPTPARRRPVNCRCTVQPLDVDPTSTNQTPERHPMSDQKPDTDTTSELLTLERVGNKVARATRELKARADGMPDAVRSYLLGGADALESAQAMIQDALKEADTARQAAMKPTLAPNTSRVRTEKDRLLTEAQMILKNPQWGELRDRDDMVIACGLVVRFDSETPAPLRNWHIEPVFIGDTVKTVQFYGQEPITWTKGTLYIRESTVQK